MRIATWNVNSIRTRADRVIDFLRRADIDVLAMQEIKCRPEQFPMDKFEAAGYQVVAHGFNQWNGVAFASRYEMSEITRAFAGQPGFGVPVKGQEHCQLTGLNGLPQEARALGVSVEGVRLWSLYVPNGRSLDNPHYAYKLEWLAKLREHTKIWLRENPAVPLALMGDFNIAPWSQDMGDPSFVEGVSTHVSEAERAEFARFTEFLTDVTRADNPQGYTFWDYQQNKFDRNLGMRIDFILGSAEFSGAVTGSEIVRDERILESGSHPEIKPSDHVPVVCDLNLELLESAWGDDDADMPMIF
ncbi:exodeoxyribonuclease III [Canibacter sp. lx-72]|nr:exodeoxyribonuclease III [Canibacter zhuwentaonis]MBT1018624.1 exodeoxyribonuclease III [Canibacter zhuwentaonis]